MAMMPKRTKFRKAHRGRLKGIATRGHRVSFGDFGLQSLDYAWLSGRQIEAGRVAASRATDGQARVWIRVFPHKPISSKPAEVRMGTGKGEVEFWAAEIRESSRRGGWSFSERSRLRITSRITDSWSSSS